MSGVWWKLGFERRVVRRAAKGRSNSRPDDESDKVIEQ